MFLTNPVINIDSVFQEQKHCGWTQTGYKVGDTATEDYLGGLHVVATYRKELFTLQFNTLNEAKCDLVEQIFNQTGINVFHKVEVITPTIRRIWDGATTAGNGTNIDINRIRQKAYFKSFKKDRQPGTFGIYKVTITCEET